MPKYYPSQVARKALMIDPATHARWVEWCKVNGVTVKGATEAVILLVLEGEIEIVALGVKATMAEEND